MLILLPLTLPELDALRSDGLRETTAVAATPALYAALGYDADMSEDAEFAALTYASVLALTKAPRRLVAVAEVPERDVTVAAEDPDGFGEVRVASVGWPQVTALFAGDQSDATSEDAAAAAALGKTLADAWESPAVAELVAATDLMWFGPGEADAVAHRAGL